jgi:hypothetical protein
MYFVSDGRPLKLISTPGGTTVLALDPSTGAMVPDERYADRLSGAEVDEATYLKLRDRLRQPILERYAASPLRWESTNDFDEPWRLLVDGHVLTIRLGDFPAEPLYLMHIDGQRVYALDDWPARWTKPGR